MWIYLSKQDSFKKVQTILQSIDGIGLINGMVIQTEIDDIHRFKRLDSLCDYAGFVPDIYSLNDKMVVRGISKRRNEYLREANYRKQLDLNTQRPGNANEV